MLSKEITTVSVIAEADSAVSLPFPSALSAKACLEFLNFES